MEFAISDIIQGIGIQNVSVNLNIVLLFYEKAQSAAGG